MILLKIQLLMNQHTHTQNTDRIRQKFSKHLMMEELIHMTSRHLNELTALVYLLKHEL
jgi:hypothetical protein